MIQITAILDARLGHGEFDIYATNSSDGGVTWPSDNVMIIGDSTFAYINYPAAVFISGGTLLAVWRDSRAGDEKGDIYMATSTDYGASWSANSRVDHALISSDGNWPVVVTTTSGGVYVLWHDYSNGNWDIYMTKATLP